MRKILLSAVVAVVGLGLFVGLGCDSNKNDNTNPNAPMAKPMTKSLYDRLGGQPAIAAVVDDFVPRAAGDPKVNFTRKGIYGAEWEATDANVAHLKIELIDFISAATGGPVKYTGKDMKGVHANMKITNAEFDAAAADLVASLNKLNVPAKEQAELMAIVGKTRADIVTGM